MACRWHIKGMSRYKTNKRRVGRLFCIAAILRLFFGILHGVADDLAVELLRIGSLADEFVQILDLHTVLGHGVAVTNGHTTIIERVMINGDTERRTDCILAAVTFTDGVP